MARPEQTERATPKRRSEARKKGQIPRSQDLTQAASFLTGTWVLHVFLLNVLDIVGHGMQGAIQHAADTRDLTFQSLLLQLSLWQGAVLFRIGILLALTLVVAIGVTLGQVGFIITFEALKPNISRINPLAGLKRLFSKQTTAMLIKQLLKLGAVILLMYQGIAGSLNVFMSLSESSPYILLTTIDQIIFGLGMRFGIFLLIVGGGDYLWERHRIEEMLKMSKQEIKDEYRQTEGSREAKAAFRRRQRELARRRMMTAVPRATVIVTNPTHYAVALHWDEKTMAAPLVVAKGADLLAKRIREVAREHHVPIVENPPLARTLYTQVALDSPVPAEMYAAVAKVIAFIYSLKARPTSAVRAV